MSSNRIDIQSENDIYLALSRIRHEMEALSFSELDKQKVLVSVSELTRNILIHGSGKGVFHCGRINEGVCLTVEDQGPGIPNVDDILQGKNVASKSGLGLGLAGVNRLMDEFYIETGEGGTKIIVVKWKDKSTHIRRNRSYVKSSSVYRSNLSGNRPRS